MSAEAGVVYQSSANFMHFLLTNITVLNESFHDVTTT